MPSLRYTDTRRLIPEITSNTKTTQLKMSTNPVREESDNKKAKDVEIRMVPKGTFAGTIEKPILVKGGEPQPEDTGDQGGGQN